MLVSHPGGIGACQLIGTLTTVCGLWAYVHPGILTGPARAGHGSQCLVAARCNTRLDFKPCRHNWTNRPCAESKCKLESHVQHWPPMGGPNTCMAWQPGKPYQRTSWRNSRRMHQCRWPPSRQACHPLHGERAAALRVPANIMCRVAWPGCCVHSAPRSSRAAGA